ncbi:MAG: glycosyltransferase [Burkholderiales bacterium]|nr:glycosyltransferase [Burkholderiales bacterium]
MSPTGSLTPTLSVVIPVYNEAAGLPFLFARLYPALDALRLEYEVIFVNDGSIDASASILRTIWHQRPDTTRVVSLAANFGQHRALLAGFSVSQGQRVVTMDADLQNPPEEIKKLMKAMDEGHDYVGTIRARRQDKSWRRWASKSMNLLRERITDIKMTDQGCMLRAYSRTIVDSINQTREASAYIPALAVIFARNPTEVVVRHESRVAGESKYSLYSLARLNFDLITGYSIVPLQVFSIFGMVVAIASVIAYVGTISHRALTGALTLTALWDRDILEFFLIGALLFGLGMVGEYVGRIFEQVRGRPLYIIENLLESARERAGAVPPEGSKVVHIHDARSFASETDRPS